MAVQVLGCTHHDASVAIRERLAFDSDQARSALIGLRREFPGVEAVLLSTCNRVELYTATERGPGPAARELTGFLARFHGVRPTEVIEHLSERVGREAVWHLFVVASSLDSMVVGETQILSQVKQAYHLAMQQKSTGPVTHAVFQAALRVARRVAGETSIHQHRLSVPSVAVADFARHIFERFEDKQTLVIGAGAMAEETLRYLKAEGAKDVVVVNRSPQRALELARRWKGRTIGWEQLSSALVAADVVISTTGAQEPIVTLREFLKIERSRRQRPLFVLDLAVPRDFDPAIGRRPAVYLYSVDDLQTVCDQNRRQRNKELPAAMKIVEQETDGFMADLRHRATGPIITRLQHSWERPKQEELKRLLDRLPELGSSAREEISRSFDRLVNKFLHAPLESLRNESRHKMPGVLADALARLFQLKA